MRPVLLIFSIKGPPTNSGTRSVVERVREQEGNIKKQKRGRALIGLTRPRSCCSSGVTSNRKDVSRAMQ